MLVKSAFKMGLLAMLSEKMITDWNPDFSLALTRAKTRDGRGVFNLMAVKIDGNDMLVGEITTRPLSCYAYEENMVLERMLWRGRSAFGMHGGDDLIDWR